MNSAEQQSESRLVQAVLNETANRSRQVLAATVSGVTSVSGVLLLAVAAWFLTGAALAGWAGPVAALAFNYLLPSAFIRFLAISRTAGRYGERYLSHWASLLAMAELRSGLFGGLASRDVRQNALPSEGEAAARLAGDIDEIEAMLVRRPARTGAWAAAGTVLVSAVLAGWRAGFGVAALLALLLLLLNWMARRNARAPSLQSVEAMGDWRARLVELAAARSEIAAYGLVTQVMATLEPATQAFENARRGLETARVGVEALLQIAAGLAVLLVLALGQGSAAQVALAGFATVAGIEALGILAQIALQAARTDQSLRRIALLEDGSVEASAPELPADAPLAMAGVELRSGERIALSGMSGSGKTTILETLAGLRGAVSLVTLGNIPLASMAMPQLTARFAISPQSAPILIGSIADNLRLARPGLDERALWSALETACLAERVRNFPHGLDERIGAGGLALSGGERKRLSLARALLAERPWVLLDEPTEGLDAVTEAMLVERLGVWLKRTGTGLILASHRSAPLRLTERTIDVRSLWNGPAAIPAV